MAFDYIRDTKHHYRDDSTAQWYLNSYSKKGGWRGLRFRMVAAREQDIVADFLTRTGARYILDLPCGTGKLAEVFRNFDAKILACDISENMLSIAKKVYQLQGCKRAKFLVCDAESASTTITEKLDVAVCLRLLHRVPTEIKTKILLEFTKLAEYAIVSFGIETPFHRVRRVFRNALLGGGTDSYCAESINQLRNLVEPDFDVLDARSVMPVLSQEVIFLLRRKPL